MGRAECFSDTYPLPTSAPWEELGFITWGGTNGWCDGSTVCVLQMELLKVLPWRRAFLAVILNLLALSLSTTALLGSYWCTGTQKVPKPLCGKSKATKCIGVPMPPDAGASNASSQDVVHYSWETGDDRFAFRYFHTGMWLSCEESMEGPGSILPSQTQLLPLILFHGSLEMKGRGWQCFGEKLSSFS